MGAREGCDYVAHVWPRALGRQEAEVFCSAFVIFPELTMWPGGLSLQNAGILDFRHETPHMTTVYIYLFLRQGFI